MRGGFHPSSRGLNRPVLPLFIPCTRPPPSGRPSCFNALKSNASNPLNTAFCACCLSHPIFPFHRGSPPGRADNVVAKNGTARAFQRRSEKHGCFTSGLRPVRLRVHGSRNKAPPRPADRRTTPEATLSPGRAFPELRSHGGALGFRRPWGPARRRSNPARQRPDGLPRGRSQGVTNRALSAVSFNTGGRFLEFTDTATVCSPAVNDLAPG
jgi:hypothetical protein